MLLLVPKILTLFIISSLSTASYSISESSYKVICLYDSWSKYRFGDGMFRIENIEPNLCSHLIYLNSDINNTNIVPSDPFLDIDEGGYLKFTQLKKKSPPLKTLLSFGRLNNGDDPESLSIRYATLLSDLHSRELFLNNTVTYLRTYNFDGLDVNLKIILYPNQNTERKEIFLTFLKQTRKMFNSYGLILSVTVSPLEYEAQFYKEICEYSDFVNILTFDYHGSWEDKTSHPSPLASQDFLDVKDTLNFWLVNGADPKKLIVGISMEGTGWKLANESNHGIGALTNGPSEPGPISNSSGYLDYTEICMNFKHEKCNYFWHNEWKAPYIVCDDQWFGFDDKRSIDFKLKFVLNNSLGGVIASTLENDDFHNKCGFGMYPLLNQMNELRKHQNSQSVIILILEILVPVISTILIILIIVIYMKKRKQLRVNDYKQFNTTYDYQNLDDLSKSHLLIQEEHLILDSIIGSGNFGCIFKGVLKHPNNEEVKIAAKKLHTVREDYDIESFLKEGLIMKDFNHENVLSLIGVSFDPNRMPIVILPLMQNGDLLSYLRNEEITIKMKHLMSFVVGISSGMKYLSELKFIHRDLAARNCMLDSDLVVKIADFGLSRDIYSREYYVCNNSKSKLPIRWMAPESIEKGVYTTKTDIWSFGVVIWEIFTRGVFPYPEVDDYDLLKFIKDERRLYQPDYCSDKLYSVMLNCWKINPKSRPNFNVLNESINQIFMTISESEQNLLISSNEIFIDT